MSFKVLKFGLVSCMFALLFAGCTTDSDDGDNNNSNNNSRSVVKGSVVYSNMVGNKTTGLSCEVSKSEESAYMKIQQFVHGSYYLMNSEYRYSPNGDGSYTVTLYMDLEFKDFPKTEAMAACKGFLEDVDEEDGFVDCNANGGHVEMVQSKTAKPLSDEILDNMKKSCEEDLKDYADDFGLNDGDSDNNKGAENQSNPSGDVTPGGQDDNNTSTSGNDAFSCNVTTEDGKVYMRTKITSLGILTAYMEMVYEEYEPDEWMTTTRTVYEGPGLASEVSEQCAEVKEEYSSEIRRGEASVVCDENSITLTEKVGYLGVAAPGLASHLQNYCTELGEEYNGYDFDGSRETPSDVPTSCKVTDGESSFTLDIVYSDWAFSSTIQYSGGVSSELSVFSGNYGDRAERMCAYDKQNSDDVVNCEEGVITVDSDWDDELTSADIKTLTQAMCSALLDGTVSFEELMFDD